MTLVAAAVCPHPPLLIATAPEAARDHAAARYPAEMRGVLAAADRAVARLAAAAPDLLVVVGGGAATRGYDADAAGSLHGYGISFRTGTGQDVLPLSLTVGRWLALRAGPGPAVLLQGVAERTRPQECLALGASLAGLAPRVALLAMGDGPARRAIRAPGAPDPGSDAYDAEVAGALAAADPARLARLDPALDDELHIAGRAAWQVLAGAAAGTTGLHGRLLCAAAPLEVSYLVCSWSVTAPGAGQPGQPGDSVKAPG